MNYITIVSDGRSSGTKVFAGDKPINGVTKIEINDLTTDDLLTARITFTMVRLGTRAEA